MIRKNIKWIGIVVTLIVICILGSVLAKNNRYQRQENGGNAYFTQDYEVLLNYEGTVIESEEYINYVRYSADGSLNVVMDEEETLWVVKGKKLVQVDKVVERFWVSTYGDTIAYMKDVEDGKGTLFLYNVRSGKSTEISDEVYDSGYSLVISPDGKSVAFLQEDKKGDTVLMVSKNGKEAEEVEGSATVCGISDNAKYVYYIKDGKFYVNDKKIESGDDVTRLYFNADYTEVLFVAGDATKYYTVKSSDVVKVNKKSLSEICVPNDTVVTYDDWYGYTYYVGVDTFNETVIALGDGLYYMYKNGEETEKITSSYSSAMLSDDGKSLVFTDDGKLGYLKNIAKPHTVEKYKKLDVDSIYVSKNLNTIYFINEDKELCYFKEGEAVVIAEDIYRAVYSDKYGVIYFLDEKELCYADKAEKSVTAITDNASYLYPKGEYITFLLDGKACVLTGKNKYKNLEE